MKWLEYARQLQAIAQAGITYSNSQYDIERFEQIREISVEIMHNYTQIEKTKIKDLFSSEEGYPTPKIDVRAVIFRNTEILLVREKEDGLWSLPGGWADIGYSLSENLIKEAKEEAGVDINPKRIISVWDREKHNGSLMPYAVYKIFVECEYIRGGYECNIETSEARFFAEDSLPPLSEGRNTKKQIDLCFKIKAKKNHEALFD